MAVCVSDGLLPPQPAPAARRHLPKLPKMPSTQAQAGSGSQRGGGAATTTTTTPPPATAAAATPPPANGATTAVAPSSRPTDQRPNSPAADKSRVKAVAAKISAARELARRLAEEKQVRCGHAP